MKKAITLFAAFAIFTLWADFKLPARYFEVISGGTAKVVRGNGFFSKAILLQAGKESEVTAQIPRTAYLFSANTVYEVDAEIKGSGKAFIELHFLDFKDQLIFKERVAEQFATEKFRDIKGKADMRGRKLAATPFKVAVVIGVEKGGSVAFDDIELDTDD